MSDSKNFFTRYIYEYIRALAVERAEFFLSICDIEEDMLEMVDVDELYPYHVVIVSNNDYSKAVRLRNDASVNCIVLLSGEGVKQIDSLKDFNEYSILHPDRQIIWDCMEEVFEIQIDGKVQIFLDTIVEKGEISFWELWNYLEKVGIQAGTLPPRELNKNLPMLGIWKSNNTDVLKKAKIGRMIRLSKYAIVESRLTKAIMENKLTARTKVNTVTKELARGSIQKILESLDFEEVEDFFKAPSRDIPDNESETTESEDSNGVEENSLISYEFLLRRETNKSVSELEAEWLKYEDGDESDETRSNKEKTDKEADTINIARAKFDLRDSILVHDVSYSEIKELIYQLNLPNEKIERIAQMMQNLWEKFQDKWDDVVSATPICLKTFCQEAKEYTQAYFELLSYLMADETVRYAVAKTGLIPKLQNLWCKISENEIKMPFYHPICIFYYMGLQRMYEYVLEMCPYNEKRQLQSQVLEAITKKIGMQFPIDFLKNGEQQYALDRTSIWKSSHMVFHNVKRGIVYSALDFYVIHNRVLDYIYNHPFMTEIVIALVDVSEWNGIQRLVEAIKNISKDKYCNLGRVTFLVLSYKEEELKSTLAQIWESMDTEDVVRFRFGRNNYWSKESDGQYSYNLSRIVEEADMTIIADGSVLYHEPRFVKLQQGSNSLYKRLEAFDLKQQTEQYFKKGKSDVPVLWDTLQYIAENRDDGLWCRKSTEIDNTVLSFINSVVSKEDEKSIVAISSNDHILSEIFRTDFLQAHRQKYNGKSITIMEFGKKHKNSVLSDRGIAKITYYFNDFYNTTLELDDFSKGIISDSQDICLEIGYESGVLQCNCSIYVEDAETKDEDSMRELDSFIQWQFDQFLREKNIITCYFSEFLLNHYFEKTQNISAVLLAEKLYKGYVMETTYKQVDKEQLKSMDMQEYGQNCMEQVKIHEMFQFLNSKEVIDEHTISQFTELFGIDVLERILRCDEIENFVQIDQMKKLKEVHEKMRR